MASPGLSAQKQHILTDADKTLYIQNNPLKYPDRDPQFSFIRICVKGYRLGLLACQVNFSTTELYPQASIFLSQGLTKMLRLTLSSLL